MKLFKRTAIISLGLLFLFSAGILAMRLDAAGEKIILAADQTTDTSLGAPNFELKDLDGKAVSLASYKGQKPVLLYFWATWCPYCIASKPQIAKIREKMGPDKMEILGIDVGEGDSLEKVKRFQKGHPSSWPILYDEGGAVSRTYHVQGIPLFVLLDKAGNVVYRDNALPEDPAKYLKE